MDENLINNYEDAVVPTGGAETKDSASFVFKSIFAASLLFLLAAYFFSAAPGSFAAPVVYHLPEGTGLAKAADNLKERGLVRSAGAFRIFFTLAYGDAVIKAGDYIFNEPLSVFGIAKRLSVGDYGATPVRVLIPEGWTVRDIGFYFENLGAFQAEEFYLPYAVDEGYLFPDTYFFQAWELNPETVRRTLRKNFEKRVTSEIRTAVELAEKNFSEIVIMASILEKEAATPEDRRIISGILWKRLTIGMALQVDASLGYITGKPSSLLTESDLKIDSPYNTYKYPGLPLGPITNPGLDSILAALEPQDSPYLYYLSDKDGEMHYAKTFEEHKTNKQKYLR